MDKVAVHPQSRPVLTVTIHGHSPASCVPDRLNHRWRCAADGRQRMISKEAFGLLVTRLDKRSALIITAFRANRVRRHRTAALRAIGDLTLLDTVMAATFAGSTIAVFSLGDSHGCLGVSMESFSIKIGPAS